MVYKTNLLKLYYSICLCSPQHYAMETDQITNIHEFDLNKQNVCSNTIAIIQLDNSKTQRGKRNPSTSITAIFGKFNNL